MDQVLDEWLQVLMPLIEQVLPSNSPIQHQKRLLRIIDKVC